MLSESVERCGGWERESFMVGGRTGEGKAAHKADGAVSNIIKKHKQNDFFTYIILTYIQEAANGKTQDFKMVNFCSARGAQPLWLLCPPAVRKQALILYFIVTHMHSNLITKFGLIW